MGTIMSNLGLLAGSSFMQSLMSLQMWGEIPGGIVGRRPSRATWEKGGSQTLFKYRDKDVNTVRTPVGG